MTAGSSVPTDFIPFPQRPMLLLFSDDSTLFFALRMRACLQAEDPDLKVEMGWVVAENALSYRQMAQLLPEGPDIALPGKTAFRELMLAHRYRAIVTSRVYGALRIQLKNTALHLTAERPCVVAFLGGLDFFPLKGRANRRYCDGVFLVPRSELAAFEAQAKDWDDRMWQELDFGHPSFLTPTPPDPDQQTQRRDIYFFAQALSPSTRRARLHMLRAMAAIARANPDRQVWIKLRHLPDENRQHLHQEKYDYTSLMDALPDVPDNLQLTACTMDEALANAGLGITCTSTAAVDIVRAGVPCMVHLDFVDNYLDQLVEPMRQLFADSGLITSLEDMLCLRTQDPAQKWLDEMFCSRDLGQQVLAMVERFDKRPLQITAYELSSQNQA
ncbi:MAG: hypothetical protein BM562_04250 [Alphaproteobacteria bacterium MedPE-SWcel]|nr:MAG: hypothetical protein BM562_04250 [Alphaproteobacteria bacterium MedPE-SWcel]